MEPPKEYADRRPEIEERRFLNASGENRRERRARMSEMRPSQRKIARLEAKKAELERRLEEARATSR